MNKRLFFTLILGLIAGPAALSATTLVFTGSSYGDVDAMLSRQELLLRTLPGGNYHLFDSGDFLGLEDLAAYSSGKLPVEIMNTFGYSGACLGNHEFDYGLDILKQRISESSFDYLSANIEIDGLPLQPWKIIEEDGLKVGIFAVSALGRKVTLQRTEIDPREAAASTVETLKEAGCSYIICLADIEGDIATSMLLENPDLDEIIVGKWNRMANYITIDERGVYFLHPNDLIVIDITFDSGGINSTISRYFTDQEASVTADDLGYTALADSINGWMSRYENEKSLVLGQTSGTVAVADLVTKLMREKTGSEVSFINSGAVDNKPLGETISSSDLHSRIKYNNTIVKATITGSVLKSMIAFHKKQKASGGKFLYFSGITEDNKINGRDIKGNEKYTVALTDFLRSGGDGYNGFSSGYQFPPQQLMTRDIVIEYCSTNQIISEEKTKKVKPTLYWKYYVDGQTQLNGNTLLDRGNSYADVLGTTESSFNLTFSYDFYNEWKNRWHLITAGSTGSFGLLWDNLETRINDPSADLNPNFSGNNLTFHAGYEFNYKWCSPYATVEFSNLIYDFVDPANAQNIKISPETGVRHHLPHDIYISESIYFDFFPAAPSFTTTKSPWEGGIKIKAHLPVTYKDIITFTNDFTLYFFLLPNIIESTLPFPAKVAFEYKAKLKIKLFKILYVDFTGIFYFDTDRLQQIGANGLGASFNLGTGISIFYGRTSR
jgi:5'-nucleotidase/UDP-sugar diphosphatase